MAGVRNDGDGTQVSVGAQRDLLVSAARAESIVVTANGVRTSALVAGSGSPLLLVHGLNPAGAIIWWPVIRELAKRFRVVAPDIPGLGQSDPVPGRLGADTASAWLTDVVHKLCGGRAAVAGTSLGGAFTLRFAVDQPEHVSKLIVINALGLGPFRPPLGYLLGTLRNSIRPSQRTLNRLVPYVVHDEQHVSRLHGEQWAAFLGCYLAAAREPLVRRTMRHAASRANARPMSATLFAQVRPPVQLIWGRYDRAFPLRVAEGAHERYGWPLEVIDDAAHLPYVEQPRPFVEALVGTAPK